MKEEKLILQNKRLKVLCITFFIAWLLSIAFYFISDVARNCRENEVEKCHSQGKCVKYLPFWRTECVECEELLKAENSK